jgi:hypothetical protein
MKGHECYHCKQWIAEGVEHDCWTTTEQALTKHLSEDLREAFERLRDTAADFGDQRIYASHHSIMFSRKSCYFFVRPQRSRLEVVFWLAREVTAPPVRKSQKTSRVKYAHVVHLVHRDQVEAPLTEWLREAYVLEDALQAPRTATTAAPKAATTKAATKPVKGKSAREKSAPKRKPKPKPKPRRGFKRAKTKKARSS